MIFIEFFSIRLANYQTGKLEFPAMVRVYHVCHAKAKDDNMERLRLANFKLISLYFSFNLVT